MPDPPSRLLVRRDSNATNARRLAAKRKRVSIVEYEPLDDINGWPNRLQLYDLEGDCDVDGTSQITSELMEIFEHLTVSVSKRPRLDTSETLRKTQEQAS